MEYCGAGSVSDLMNITGKTLTEDQIAVVCQSATKVKTFTSFRFSIALRFVFVLVVQWICVVTLR